MQTILDGITGGFVLQGQDAQDVVVSMLLAVFIGVVISQVYKHTHRGMNFELSFMSTLVLLAPIVAVVMLFIRGDLVLSLGLIGSLSIIRFRTPVKDTRDMVFLFWTIAAGLGCGTFNWNVVVISTLVLTMATIALYITKYGRSYNSDYVLVVSGTTPEGVDSREEKDLEAEILAYVAEARLRSFEIEGGHWEAIYELRFPRSMRQMNRDLIRTIQDRPGVSKVSLLAPQMALPV